MSISSAFPGFEHLYWLRSPASDEDFIAKVDFDTARPLAVTRGVEVVGRLAAKWAMGSSTPGDVIWPDSGHAVLFSRRIVEALSRAECSGWNTYEVDVKGKSNEGLGLYYGLIVQGRCGAINNSGSKPFMKKYPAGERQLFKGLYFEEASWDGSDVFMSSDFTGWIFTTDRARQAILTVAKDHVVFDPLTEVERRVL